MKAREISLIVISHASIRQINRTVYRELRNSIQNLYLIIPDFITLQSGAILFHEPPLDSDPIIIPLELKGSNPRTYFYPRLIEILNERLPDIILLENDPVSRLGWMLSGWVKRNQKRLICQSYENIRRDMRSTLFNQGLRELLKNLFLHYLYRIMSTRIDSILVVNRDSQSLFEFYKYEQVTLIPLGYDPKVFFCDPNLRAEFRQKVSADVDTVIIAYFGRMVYQKGVHLLIEALGSISEQKWLLLLDHAFDSHDDYASRIKLLISDLKLNERVYFFEADHFEIANYMRASDIVVAPSLTTQNFKEQYGRAIQEAMACGCVCLVSDSGHLKDLVGDLSLVFPENNVEELTKVLRKFLIDEDMRHKFSQVLAHRAYENFTILRQSARLYEVIDSLYQGIND